MVGRWKAGPHLALLTHIDRVDLAGAVCGVGWWPTRWLAGSLTTSLAELARWAGAEQRTRLPSLPSLTSAPATLDPPTPPTRARVQLNIAMATTSIPFWQFTLVSAVGIIFECSVVAYFGRWGGGGRLLRKVCLLAGLKPGNVS